VLHKRQELFTNSETGIVGGRTSSPTVTREQGGEDSSTQRFLSNRERYTHCAEDSLTQGERDTHAPRFLYQHTQGGIPTVYTLLHTQGGIPTVLHLYTHREAYPRCYTSLLTHREAYPRC